MRMTFTEKQARMARRLGNSPMTDSLADRLEQATVGSCTCLTKSHDIQYHATDCHYRLFDETAAALREWEALALKLGEAATRKEQRIAELQNINTGHGARIAELEALRPYVQHKPTCSHGKILVQWPEGCPKCTCGLDEINAKA